MDKQWYMTVGYPGGEFAWDGRKPLPRGKIPADQPRRRCPPDVAEWLDATMGEVCDGRQKVPGGWLYLWSKCDYGQGYAALAQSFVPVPGTANITVLEPAE